MARRGKRSAGALAQSVLLRPMFCSCWQATQMKGWRSGVVPFVCTQAARLPAPGLGAAEPAAGQAPMALLERCSVAAARGLELSCELPRNSPAGPTLCCSCTCSSRSPGWTSSLLSWQAAARRRATWKEAAAAAAAAACKQPQRCCRRHRGPRQEQPARQQQEEQQMLATTGRKMPGSKLKHA